MNYKKFAKIVKEALKNDRVTVGVTAGDQVQVATRYICVVMHPTTYAAHIYPILTTLPKNCTVRYKKYTKEIEITDEAQNLDRVFDICASSNKYLKFVETTLNIKGNPTQLYINDEGHATLLQAAFTEVFESYLLYNSNPNGNVVVRDFNGNTVGLICCVRNLNGKYDELARCAEKIIDKI